MPDLEVEVLMYKGRPRILVLSTLNSLATLFIITGIADVVNFVAQVLVCLRLRNGDINR